jgi:uncharacterized membrane protein
MWTRLEIKEKAKSVLRKYYWQAFIVSLVLGFATGGSSGGGGGSSRWTSSNSLDLAWIPLIILLVVFAIIFAVLFRIFIGYAIEVGAKKFFLETLEDQSNMGRLGYAFTSGHYKNIISTMFIRTIMLIGWFLLLIIPGIIKSYAYRMVPYILSENPNIDAREAIELSENMTKGHKMDIFILDLSFVGWFILGALLCGIGIIFVMPYYNTAQAVLYTKLKSNIMPDQASLDDGYYE